jgi:hypothetical protein
MSLVSLMISTGIVAVGLGFLQRRRNRLVNNKFTSKQTILQQMNELRPLPMGMKEFDEWSDRILSGAMIPSDNRESLKAVLSSMILALGHTEDHKPDAYFIHLLRKAAANEVASAVFQAAKAKRNAEAQANLTKEQEAAHAAKVAEVFKQTETQIAAKAANLDATRRNG